MLAASILLATILVLVDKNHQWHNFWRVLGVLLLLGALSAGAFYGYGRYEARQTTPPLPPGYTLDQPSH